MNAPTPDSRPTLRPIFYDDIVEIHTRVKPPAAGLPRSRVKVEHDYDLTVIERQGQRVELPCAPASTTLACVDNKGKPRALPAWSMAEH